MKVLMVSSVASMILQFNKSNLSILIDLGYTVEVACNFKQGNTCTEEDVQKLKLYLDDLGVKYHQIDFVRSPLSLKMLHSYAQLKKLLKNTTYDMVHCHSPVASILTRLICKKHRKKGLKVIYTAHGFHFFKGAPLFSWLIYYPIEKFCARFTDVLITINQEDYTLAKTKMKAKKVVYIPGVGVDTQKYTDVVINREEKCKVLGLPTDCKILLSVGELNENKNHQVVMRALAKLQDPSIHYLVAGTGSLAKELLLLSQELDIEAQAHFIGYRRDIGELCKLSDVFCFPSRREGLSVALMEAMGSGLPCVVSWIRGNTDLIKDGQGGCLVDANSVDEFAVAIKALLSDEDNKMLMAQYNQEAVKQFDIGNVDEEMRGIYGRK